MFSWRYSIYQEYVLLYLKVFMEITPDTLDWMSRTTWKKPGLCEASGEKLPNQFLFVLGVERKKTHQLLTFTKSGYFAKILAPEPKKSWWGGAQPRTGYPDTPVAPTTGAKPSWKTQQSDAVSSSLPPFPSSVAPRKSQVTSSDPTKTGFEKLYTLQGIYISHLGKRKIIFKMPFLGDMLVSWRVSNKIFSPFVSRNASDPESLRYLASACRNDLFFSSASSSAWWSDFWIKTSLSKQKGRNIRDSTNSETKYGRVSSLDPSQCHVETLLGDDCKATNMRHIDDSNPMRNPSLLLFSSLRSLQVLKRLSSRTENQFGWRNRHILRKLRSHLWREKFQHLFSEDVTSFFHQTYRLSCDVLWFFVSEAVCHWHSQVHP